jgi:hypothetical protein
LSRYEETIMARRSLVQRLRQHHGVEHATITLLSQRLPGVQLIGRSDHRGFMVYGNVDTAVLCAAAEEALARLQAGEFTLAVHPNCGTNLVTAGTLSGLAGLLAGAGRRRSLWDRLPSAVLGATIALILAQPLGRWVQTRVTTTSAVAGLRIASVIQLSDGPTACHRVVIG